MKPVSRRTPGPGLPGAEFLDTRYAGKTFKVTVTARPEQLADGKAIPDGEEVLVTTLDNPFQVINHLTNLLGKAKTGASLVVICTSDKIQRVALKFLGFGNTAGQ